MQFWVAVSPESLSASAVRGGSEILIRETVGLGELENRREYYGFCFRLMDGICWEKKDWNKL